ncbi:hypothetical protein [Ruegeria atlantica]|uniref:Uncharacterized protein n=1 Tax=Ruegeria atlantica TaxID=81569 RepID=A0A0P1EI08_9RHOB|nr:hypothetical protein [Ruegeria atlantica]CUH50089.1 hypothetical protein RUA4292_04295 [Ruegeria atlantica]
MRAAMFDIGDLLLDWQPHLAWAEDLASEDAAQSVRKSSVHSTSPQVLEAELCARGRL